MAVFCDFNKKEMQIMEFETNNVKYAIPVSYIRSIISSKNLMKMSRQPLQDEMVINFDGENIPVFNLDNILSGEFYSKDLNKNAILVLKINNMSFGFYVNKIDQVVKYNYSDIKLPPNNNYSINKYLLGFAELNDKYLQVLNPYLFFEKVRYFYASNYF